MAEMIKHETRQGTAFITIDNPPANTWTPESLRALEKLIGELTADTSVRAAVISGSGGKFFSAGADLKTFNATRDAAREFVTRFGTAFEAMMNSRLVTIAAI